jgi:hypothetical protein
VIATDPARRAFVDWRETGVEQFHTRIASWRGKTHPV